MAFVVVEITIRDPETYKQYMALAPASIAKYKGRYLVRGGTTEALEGSWNPQRFVILEFPSAQAARDWWSSPEYTEARNIRVRCADARMLLVDGPSFDPAKA
ncbi:MAG TPA: DUF1330 domain-containing protein [Gemmatimonadaceae bacterium]|nr:DUF1330 domain-containing protein [Gemmatimonadaceae bacterium]